ncbi:MAG: hypothetical protein JWM47_267 [Acidimicrobiales bacterium]|nr:hypothetical protein [Acidimicrobiales bacterium]
MVMQARDVLDVLDVLVEDGVDPVLHGGWGIEALLAAQHRDHADLDLVVLDDEIDRAVTSLTSVGFELVEDHRPSRASAVDAAGRHVDLQAVRPDERGDYWQRATEPDDPEIRFPGGEITTGWVGGRQVRCIGAVLQVAHHSGYPPQPHDHEDLDRLKQRFGVTLPPAYQ